MLEDELQSECYEQLHFLKAYTQPTLQLLTDVIKHNNITDAIHASRLNHSPHDRRFIQSILHDKSITIKPADKNLGLVFVDTSWYNDEIKRMLSDSITYTRCQTLINKFGKVIPFSFDVLKSNLLHQLKKLTDRHESTLKIWQQEHADQMIKHLHHSITKENAQLPRIYLLIKVHKSSGLCGRPIVPCTKWITTPASRVADHLLQHIFNEANIKWIVHDTKSLINDIEQHPIIQHDGIFLTADIASLYTNIDTELGLSLVEKFLIEQDTPDDHIKLIMDFLSFVMNNAYFTFGNDTYHQIDGTAMGTIVAPIYANIVVYMLERDIVQLFYNNQSLYEYKRYLDDLFIFLSPDVVNEFMQAMNSLHSKLRFEFVQHPSEASFLDLLIHKGHRFTTHRIFDTRVHQKKMNLYLYIPYHSHHTSSSKRSFIQTELIRYIRNSSDQQDYIQLMHVFFQRLRDRGYPSWFLEPIFHSIHYCDRIHFLSDSTSITPSNPRIIAHPPQSLCLINKLNRHRPQQQNKQLQQLVFIIPYNPLSALIPIRRILSEHWGKLQLAFSSVQIVKPIIAYQSCPSLTKTLVFAKDALHHATNTSNMKQATLYNYFRCMNSNSR